jgi:hypothetical protein
MGTKIKECDTCKRLPSVVPLSAGFLIKCETCFNKHIWPCPTAEEAVQKWNEMVEAPYVDSPDASPVPPSVKYAPETKWHLNDKVDECVYVLNEEIYSDSTGELAKLIEDYPPLDYLSDGNTIIIRLFQCEIWNSEEQDRPTDDDGEFINTLINDIRVKVNKRAKLIGEIDL